MIDWRDRFPLNVPDVEAAWFTPTPETTDSERFAWPWHLLVREPFGEGECRVLIASVLYRAGIIERWGSGTLNLVDWCAENGNPPPKWREDAGSVFVIFAPSTPGGGPEVTGEVRSLLSVCRGTMTRRELQDALALKSEENFRVLYLTPALDAGLVEMTIPEKPRSSKQKYRLTEKGRRLLSQVVEDSK